MPNCGMHRHSIIRKDNENALMIPAFSVEKTGFVCMVEEDIPVIYFTFHNVSVFIKYLRLSENIAEIYFVIAKTAKIPYTIGITEVSCV